MLRRRPIAVARSIRASVWEAGIRSRSHPLDTSPQSRREPSLISWHLIRSRRVSPSPSAGIAMNAVMILERSALNTCRTDGAMSLNRYVPARRLAPGISIA